MFAEGAASCRSGGDVRRITQEETQSLVSRVRFDAGKKVRPHRAHIADTHHRGIAEFSLNRKFELL